MTGPMATVRSSTTPDVVEMTIALTRNQHAAKRATLFRQLVNNFVFRSVIDF